MAKSTAAVQLEVINNVSNDGSDDVTQSTPYNVDLAIEGNAPILFHAWSCDAVEMKSKVAKNSAAKKTDNIESYVWRQSDDVICLPGEYLRQAMINAARYRQDPRSPRKSAMDLFKAALVCLTEFSPIGTDAYPKGAKTWEYIDRRRVTVQRNGITRQRPAFKIGWKAQFTFMVLTPEYIDRNLFAAVLADAGRLIGVGDFRPTFGRFFVSLFK